VIEGRVADIRDVLTTIHSILSWQRLSTESRQQLMVFKNELEQELRSLLDTEWKQAA
jgi:hypothetical protein